MTPGLLNRGESRSMLSKPSAQASTTSGGWANSGYACEPKNLWIEAYFHA